MAVGFRVRSITKLALKSFLRQQGNLSDGFGSSSWDGVVLLTRILKQ